MEDSILVLKNYMDHKINSVYNALEFIESYGNDEMNKAIACDTYELSEEMYDFMNELTESGKRKDKKYYEMMFKAFTSNLNMNTIDICMKKIPEKYKFLRDYLYGNIYDIINKKNDVNNEENEEENEEENVNDDNEENVNDELGDMDNKYDEEIYNSKFEWRESQLEALNNMKKMNYESGIVSHIMGAGKSLIMLKCINDHNINVNKNQKGVYIITCFRQEVLKKMLFETKKKRIGDEIMTTYEIDKKKKTFWKYHNIIDMDNYNIVDCINAKPTKIEEIKKSSYENKPTLIIINNDYLKALDKKKLLEKILDDLKLIIIDECHSISADGFYDLLLKIKTTRNFNKMIGFSATPLREKAEDKLLNIFGKMEENKEENKIEKKLNVISHYDIICAIKDGIILPFKFYCIELNNNNNELEKIMNKNKNENKTNVNNKLMKTNDLNKIMNIGKSNKEIIKKTLDDILTTVPYKKGIGWCKDRKQLKMFHNFLKTIYTPKNIDVYWTCTTNNFTKPTNEDEHENLDKFYESKGNSFLLCVNRCKEGSDIDHIDYGIFFDSVKKRSTLVSMQCSGRICRPDKEGKKTHGIILDTFIRDKDKSEEVITIQKIIQYFEKLLHISTEDSFNEKNKEMYKMLKKMTTKLAYDYENNEINLQITENKKVTIKFNYQNKKFDWIQIKEQLNRELDKKYNITREERFFNIVRNLKSMKIFNENSIFNDVYKNISKEDKLKYDLPENIIIEYEDKFNNQTWFEILGYDTTKYTKYEDYIKYMKNDNKNKMINMRLPKDVNELYRLFELKKNNYY